MIENKFEVNPQWREGESLATPELLVYCHLNSDRRKLRWSGLDPEAPSYQIDLGTTTQQPAVVAYAAERNSLIMGRRGGIVESSMDKTGTKNLLGLNDDCEEVVHLWVNPNDNEEIVYVKVRFDPPISKLVHMTSPVAVSRKDFQLCRLSNGSEQVLLKLEPGISSAAMDWQSGYVIFALPRFEFLAFHLGERKMLRRTCPEYSMVAPNPVGHPLIWSLKGGICELDLSGAGGPIADFGWSPCASSKGVVAFTTAGGELWVHSAGVNSLVVRSKGPVKSPPSTPFWCSCGAHFIVHMDCGGARKTLLGDFESRVLVFLSEEISGPAAWVSRKQFNSTVKLD